MLSEKRLAEIRKSADDAQFGNNTQDMWRRYHKDVKELLEDREELTKQANQLFQECQVNRELGEKLQAVKAELASAQERIVELEGRYDSLNLEYQAAMTNLAVSNATEEVDG